MELDVAYLLGLRPANFLNRCSNRSGSISRDMFTPSVWEKAKQDYDDEARKAKELEKQTLDFLQLGDSVSEKNHQLTHAKSYSGKSNSRRWRDAREDGFVTFTLKAEPGIPHVMTLTYWGSDGGGRLLFDIIVECETVATQEVRQNFPNRFFEVRYNLIRNW